KVPNLREGHALKHPDSEFVKQITKGGDGMPAFGQKLKPEEINDMVRFIRHEFQGGMMPPGEPMKSPMQGMKMNMKSSLVFEFSGSNRGTGLLLFYGRLLTAHGPLPGLLFCIHHLL